MIGILTLSASDNCGSLLQAYSLQQYLLRRFYADSEIIDFRPEVSEKIYAVFPGNPLRAKRKTINALCNYKLIKSQKEDYEKFRHNWIKLSDMVCKDENDLRKLEKYSCIIVGSDQVWNVMMLDFHMAYFLGWFSGDKYAYAPSVGGHLIQESDNTSQICECLRRFRKLSAREEFGKKSIEDLTERKVELVLDPTLLLTQKEWKESINERLVEGEYIFYYSWAYNNDSVNRKVEEFSNKVGLPVYVMNVFKWYKHKPDDYGFHMSKESGPLAFLSLMKYAEYALVQSFHGVIFAYQMGKIFFFLDDCTEDKMDVRLKQVLILLNKLNCVLRPEDDIYQKLKHIDDNELDFAQLLKLRKESHNYLKNIVEDQK